MAVPGLCHHRPHRNQEGGGGVRERFKERVVMGPRGCSWVVEALPWARRCLDPALSSGDHLGMWRWGEQDRRAQGGSRECTWASVVPPSWCS